MTQEEMQAIVCPFQCPGQDGLGQQTREYSASCADDARERAGEEALQMGQTVSCLALAK